MTASGRETTPACICDLIRDSMSTQANVSCAAHPGRETTLPEWVWTNLRCPSCTKNMQKDRTSTGTFQCWFCGDTWTRTGRTNV